MHFIHFIHSKQGYEMMLYQIDNRQIDSIFIHSV